MVLDNAESILQGGDKAGEYREGYEEYGELFRRVGGVSHQSCLIITSREKPQEIASSEGETLPIRSLQLTGLKARDGEEIFLFKGLSGTEDEQTRVIDFYQGNPPALKIISTTIKELFDGSISEFLAQESVVFGKIRDVLDQQFNRLSDLERQVMYWLAINREPVFLSELRGECDRTKCPPKRKAHALTFGDACEGSSPKGDRSGVVDKTLYNDYSLLRSNENPFGIYEYLTALCI